MSSHRPGTRALTPHDAVQISTGSVTTRCAICTAGPVLELLQTEHLYHSKHGKWRQQDIRAGQVRPPPPSPLPLHSPHSLLPIPVH